MKHPILALSVPLSSADSFSSTHALTYRFTTSEAPSVASVKSVLSKGVIEINVDGDLGIDKTWDNLEEFLSQVLQETDTEDTKPTIILCK